MSDVLLLGYAGAAVLALCMLSGLVLTGQPLFGENTWAWLRYVHLISTLLGVAMIAPHLVLALWRRRNGEMVRAAMKWRLTGAGGTVAATIVIVVCTASYSGTRYPNIFPADYSFAYGANRPFAPGLAHTSTNGAFDPRLLVLRLAPIGNRSGPWRKEMSDKGCILKLNFWVCLRSSGTER